LAGPATAQLDGKKRRPHRRDQILAAAMDLFHAKGYHATGMDEIGAAAGITGPGIYRHFKSKEQILATGVRRSVTEALDNARSIVESTSTPREALEGLIANFVEGLLANRSLSAVIMRERHALSPTTRRSVERAERLHVEEWVHILSQLRPDLTDGESRMMVHAGLWTCLSVAYYESGIDPEREGQVLTQMVRAALLCDVPHH
jgi:AcrR family transcriptional regulator